MRIYESLNMTSERRRESEEDTKIFPCLIDFILKVKGPINVEKTNGRKAIA